MSSNNSFGGKLRKVLASMCSLFVGASGVSRANPPGTAILAEPRFGKDANIFGFGDIGWRNLPQGINKADSWLNGDITKYQRIPNAMGVNVDVGFSLGDDSTCVAFCVWFNDNDIASIIRIPKGILFDVMRYFEGMYFPNDSVESQVGKLSCYKGNLNADVANEVFLRFILWAFCGSKHAINPKHVTTVEELKKEILNFVVSLKGPSGAGSKFEVYEYAEGEKKKECAILRTGYLLENFNGRVRDVYGELGCDVTDAGKMVDIIVQRNAENLELRGHVDQLNKKNEELQQKLNGLNIEKGNLQKQLDDLNIKKGNLQDRVNQLVELQQNYAKEYDLLSKENESLSKRLESLNMEKGNLQKQLEALDGGNFQEQLDILNNDKLDLQKQLSDLNIAKNDLQQRYENLEAEKNTLEKQLDDYDAVGLSLQRQLSNLDIAKNDLQQRYNTLEVERNDLQQRYNQLKTEKRNLESQKRAGSALNVLIGLIGGGVLVEGTHRFLGAKRSRSSEVNKDKISSNGKNGQKAEKNLKKRRS